MHTFSVYTPQIICLWTHCRSSTLDITAHLLLRGGVEGAQEPLAAFTQGLTQRRHTLSAPHPKELSWLVQGELSEFSGFLWSERERGPGHRRARSVREPACVTAYNRALGVQGSGSRAPAHLAAPRTSGCASCRHPMSACSSASAFFSKSAREESGSGSGSGSGRKSVR